MPIRPIDMQTIIPQMEKIDAAKNKSINKVDNANQQNQLQTKEDAANKPNQVATLEQKDHNAVNNDDRDRSNNKSRGQKKKQGQEEEDEEEQDSLKSKKILRGHFDMKI